MLPIRRVGVFALRWRTLPLRVRNIRTNTRALFDGIRTFDFNNEKRAFTGDWNDPEARKLWLYNLHYMTWLFDLPENHEGWILKWIRANLPERGGTGWEPYPLSLRLFNWCKHFSLSGTEPDSEVRASMEKQASRLLADLEYHLDGNHLLENLLALAYVGLHSDLRDVRMRAIRERIRRSLEAALAEQFLEDGGHFELSPMYHAILLERILDLLNAWPQEEDPFPGLADKLRAVAGRALDWLEVMTVGGRFALFNDACYDAAPESARLLEFGNRLLSWKAESRDPLRRPGASLRALSASGYFRAEAGPATVIFDAGKLGPDHQMGHAQGDMLSFCLWLRDVPVLVHPGNFEYLPGVMRNYCRSTAAHNTLVIDGCEQADWWASHRVGWRGRPREAHAEQGTGDGRMGHFGPIRLQGAHDGYSRLPGRPLHRRKLELSVTALEIRDELTADPRRPSRIYFHFHPDCMVEARNGKIGIRCAGGLLELEADHPVRLEESWYCPEFGLRIRNVAAVVEASGRDFLCTFTFTAD